MTEEKPQKQKPKRDWTKHAARKKAKEAAARLAAMSDEEKQELERIKQEKINADLMVLQSRTAGNTPDADGDIMFAYHSMSNPDLMPLQAPSTGAWNWYKYARNNPDDFLVIFAKREDAKTKQTGSLTQRAMEDDKRKQFAILDRIERQLTLDVNDMVDDLMSKFPENVLHRCRYKHPAAWEAFLKKYPI